MPMVHVLAVLETIIALVVLLFLLLTFTYLVAPQSLDRFLKGLGLRQGLQIFNARTVFAGLRQLGFLLVVLGVITLFMIFFQQWPRGWLIPAIQELFMAVVLIIVGVLGGKNRLRGKK
ncbi:MAG: hypothetical protein K0041_01430 [Acidithiobacillus sp.]|nr:hypothetical protein [Acidithiobacillus sp.]